MPTPQTHPTIGHPGERRLLAAVLAMLLPVAGCGGDGEEAYPSGDWSGRYGTTVSEAATDCHGATAPPAMTGFILDIEHHKNNRATVTMNPIVRLAGEFQGDRLEAMNVVRTPVELPDSLLARVTEADSIETITYRLEADFSREGLVGRYVIRAPDLRALVLEGEAARCQFRYRLAGQRIAEAGDEGLPPGFEPVLPDTLSADDPAVVPADTAG
ncbi:MAG: hypothetical protein ACREK5_09980 [Gemmatimonadota bacterium]